MEVCEVSMECERRSCGRESISVNILARRRIRVMRGNE